MIGVKDNIAIQGKVTIRTYKAGTVERAELFFERAKLANDAGLVNVRDEYRRMGKETLAEGYVATPVVQQNLVMQSPNYGKDIIIQRLVGNNTYSLNILFGEIGTGTTTPAVTDTGLTTPTNRAAVGFQQDFGTTDAVLQFFFPDGQLANATYNEFGTFVDGNATIGTGQIFNHALFSSPYIKVSGQDTTVEVDFSIS
jgi:hypothetical protein